MGKRKLFFGAWMDMRAKNNCLPKKFAEGAQLYNKINIFDLASWSSHIYFGPPKMVSVVVYFEDQILGTLSKTTQRIFSAKGGRGTPPFLSYFGRNGFH